MAPLRSCARLLILPTIAELTARTLETPLTEESLILALRPTLASKQYGAEDLLAKLVAEAVLAVMPKDPKAVSSETTVRRRKGELTLRFGTTVQRRQRSCGQDHGRWTESEPCRSRNGLWSRA